MDLNPRGFSTAIFLKGDMNSITTGSPPLRKPGSFSCHLKRNGLTLTLRPSLSPSFFTPFLNLCALTPKLSWFPEDAPLGRVGVDLASFAAVRVYAPTALDGATDPTEKRAIARSLRWTTDDSAPFYESLAAERGCPCLRIDTNEKNAVARRMYARHGYRESGVIPCEFNGIPDVGLVCMEKVLLP